MPVATPTAAKGLEKVSGQAAFPGNNRFAFTRGPPVITYAFGDVHGCLEQLKKLVAHCLKEAQGCAATFVFLGDYIDRGPESMGVVQFLMDMQSGQGPVAIICLAGNHEQCALKVAEGTLPKHHWTGVGGASTLLSYGVGHASQI